MVILSVTESLLNFSKSLDDGFFASLRETFFGKEGTGTNGLWGTWYGIIAAPLVIMFAVKGIQLMMGSIDGDKLRKEFRKFGYSLLLLGFGMFGMPIIELVAKEMNGLMKEKVLHAADGMYNINKQRLDQLKQKESVIQGAMFHSITGIDPETSNFIKNNTTNQNILLDQSANEEAKKQSQILTKQEVVRMQEIQHESGASDNLTNIVLKADAKELQDISAIEAENKKWEVIRNMNPENMAIAEEDEGLLSWSFGSILTNIFMVLGTLIQIIIMFVRGVLLIILRFAFPIVVAMSFFPTFEGAVKEWWESYKSLALWLIPITIIEVVSQVSWVVARTSVTPESSGIVNAMVAFVCGILYLLVPTITSMLFGGSPAMAGISQQMMSAGAVMWTLAKGTMGTMKKTGDIASKVDTGARSGIEALFKKPPPPVG